MTFTHNSTRNFAAAVIVAGLLAGCSASPDSDATGDEPTPTPAPAVDTGCVARTWLLDIPDLASQMAIQVAADGLEVTEYAGVGYHTLTFTEDGTAAASVDMTVTLTATSGAGPEITVVQIHTGEPIGEWGWLGDSNVVTFANWDDGGYAVQNITSVGGFATEDAIDLPADPLGGSNLEIVCDGSSLSTHNPASPYTQHWTAED